MVEKSKSLLYIECFKIWMMLGIVAAKNESDCVCECIYPCQGLSRLGKDTDQREHLKENNRRDTTLSPENSVSVQVNCNCNYIFVVNTVL